MRYFLGLDFNFFVNFDGILVFFLYFCVGGMLNRYWLGYCSFMFEWLIWSYIIQLLFVLRFVYVFGLVCRVIDFFKILLIGNLR